MDPCPGAGHHRPGHLAPGSGATGAEPATGAAEQHSACLPVERTPDLQPLWSADDRCRGRSGSASLYVCSARYPRHARGACDGRSITAAHVEAQVWRWTAKLLSEPTLLRARFEESRGDLSADSAGQHEGARIERQLRGLDREIERLIDAYQATAITLAELQKRRRGIEDHRPPSSSAARRDPATALGP